MGASLIVGYPLNSHVPLNHDYGRESNLNKLFNKKVVRPLNLTRKCINYMICDIPSILPVICVVSLI